MISAILGGVAVVVWLISLELVFRFGQNRGRKQIMDKVTSVLDEALKMLVSAHEDCDDEEEVPAQKKRKTPKRDKHGHFIKITKNKK